MYLQMTFVIIQLELVFFLADHSFKTLAMGTYACFAFTFI